MKTTINGHAVEVEKVGTQKRDARRSTRSGRCDRFVTVYTWNAVVDGRVVMDGCSTRAEALEYATKAAK